MPRPCPQPRFCLPRLDWCLSVVTLCHSYVQSMKGFDREARPAALVVAQYVFATTYNTITAPSAGRTKIIVNVNALALLKLMNRTPAVAYFRVTSHGNRTHFDLRRSAQILTGNIISLLEAPFRSRKRIEMFRKLAMEVLWPRLVLPSAQQKPCCCHSPTRIWGCDSPSSRRSPEVRVVHVFDSWVSLLSLGSGLAWP